MTLINRLSQGHDDHQTAVQQTAEQAYCQFRC